MVAVAEGMFAARLLRVMLAVCATLMLITLSGTPAQAQSSPVVQAAYLGVPDEALANGVSS